MSTSLLHRIDFARMGAAGYAFQIASLHAAMKSGAHIIEVPISFHDRTSGTSKLRMYDLAEFLFVVIKLLLAPTLQPLLLALSRGIRDIAIVCATTAVCFIAGMHLINGTFPFAAIGLILFLLLSLSITIQSMFTLYGMIYAWEEPQRLLKNRSPRVYVPPQYSFTAIVPALHESAVIGDTLRAVASIRYPADRTEILVVCREDDTETIAAANQAIHDIGAANIRVIIPNLRPKNKPDKLNTGLLHANHDIVCVFDAEDSPHPDIYHIVNTVMVADDVDVVQSGVQLINFDSNWFSTLNVLEYFFWFKSVLHVFAQEQAIPLGGNTVFFKRNWLIRIGGWDSSCLTEDADIGIRLSAAGARLRIIYDEIHATQEETPPTFGSFIKQRTRWNQGFIQIFKKQSWKHLRDRRQQILVGYILLWPEIQALLFAYVIASVIMMVTVKLHIVLAIFSLLPLYILFMHLCILNVGLYEFTKKFHKQYAWWLPLKICATFIPFQIGLGISAVRAVIREWQKKSVWEKTEHTNAHRTPAPAAGTVSANPSSSRV